MPGAMDMYLYPKKSIVSWFLSRTLKARMLPTPIAFIRDSIALDDYSFLDICPTTRLDCASR
jgi:hypothetical protein